MKKLYLYCIVLFLLNSCAPLLETLEMNRPQLSCVKKERKNEYSVFGVQFKKKSDLMSFIPGDVATLFRTVFNKQRTKLCPTTKEVFILWNLRFHL